MDSMKNYQSVKVMSLIFLMCCKSTYQELLKDIELKTNFPKQTFAYDIAVFKICMKINRPMQGMSQECFPPCKTHLDTFKNSSTNSKVSLRISSIISLAKTYMMVLSSIAKESLKKGVFFDIVLIYDNPLLTLRSYGE